MKKFFFTLLTLCLCGATYAQDFSAVNTEGTTIYYNILTDVEGNQVEVTYNGTNHSTAQTYSGELTIPGTVTYEETTYNVTAIGEYAVYNCQVTSVTIGENVTTIGDEAFESSSLTSIEIPNTVQTIGKQAFAWCQSLTTATINGGTIGEQAFYWDMALTEVNIGDGVTSIGDEAFDSCENLATVSIGSGVSYIGSGAFGDCDITNFTIAEGNTSYVMGTAENGGVGILYSADYTVLLQDLFYEGESLTVPESVTTIGEEAFAKSSLVTLTLGSNVSSIGDDAFWSCSSLTTVNCLNPVPPTCATNAFLADSGVTVYVPAGTIDYYTEQWTGINNETLAELTYAVIKITAAEGYATYYNEDYDVTMPEGVTAYTVSEVEANEDEESSTFSITLTAVSGAVPAGTAVVIEGSAATYSEVSVTSSSSTGTEGNMLYGSSTTGQTTVDGTTEGYYFYKLSHNSAGNVGFYWGAENAAAFDIDANKAWLAVPTSTFDSVSPTAFSFKKSDNDTTGISAVESASEKTVSGIYTIQGVRVSNMNQPGLYIVDGKKVLVK